MLKRSVRKVTYWATCNLDFILNVRDELYNSLGFAGRQLNVNELSNAALLEIFYSLRKLRLETGLISLNVEENFLNNFNQFSANRGRNGIIFIIRGFSFIIIYTNQGVYLLNSHSRDGGGFTSPVRIYETGLFM